MAKVRIMTISENQQIELTIPDKAKPKDDGKGSFEVMEGLKQIGWFYMPSRVLIYNPEKIEVQLASVPAPVINR